MNYQPSLCWELLPFDFIPLGWIYDGEDGWLQVSWLRSDKYSWVTPGGWGVD